MSQFETSESPKEVFGELGKRWIKQVKITKDFRSIFMRHLSDFASRCFEVYSAPNLKAAINEEKCQRIIFTTLEYFLCGEDPFVGFQKLLNANSPSQLCGKVFKVGEPTYSCRFATIYEFYWFCLSTSNFLMIIIKKIEYLSRTVLTKRERWSSIVQQKLLGK